VIPAGTFHILTIDYGMTVTTKDGFILVKRIIFNNDSFTPRDLLMHDIISLRGIFE